MVHITTVHPPLDTRIFYKECKTIAESEFDLTLIVTDSDDLDASTLPNNFDILTLPKPSGRINRMTSNALKAYKSAKNLKANVYHIHDPELLWVGRLLKNKYNHVVYDVHEDYETSIKQKDYIYKPVRKVVASAFNVYEHMMSRKMVKCLAEKYYSKKFPDGFQVLNYPLVNNKNKDRGKQNAPSQSSEIKLLYTGNVGLDRGALNHAVLPKLDKRINVTYVGKCTEKIEEKIKKTAGHSTNRIKIIGVNEYIPRDRIDQYYEKGDWVAGLALFPKTEHYSQKELTKFFEYMSFGIPIICTNFKVWDEFVRKHDCGFAVDPNDEEQIKKAIMYLHNNPERAKEMGNNGKSAIENELNWDYEGQKLMNWYRNLVGIV